MNRVYILFFFFITLNSAFLQAQEPFWACDGSFILSAGGDLFINRTIPGDEELTLEAIPIPNIGKTNAIAYRRFDNCIYGVDNNEQGLNKIFRLSPLGEYEIIDTLENNEIHFGSATMSFDDKHLILYYRYNLLSIDITDNNSSPLIIPLSDNSISFDFGDIALDLVDNKIHGLSQDANKFIVINPQNGNIERQYFFSINSNIFSSSAVGFINNQVLVGTVSSSNNPILGFYHLNSNQIIDEITGEIPTSTNYNWDACSCIDFDLLTQQTINNDSLYQCQKSTTTIKIVNRLETATWNNLTLIDSFPPGVIINEIIHNPYSGNVEGIGTNILNISNFIPAFGVDSIVLSITITEDADIGNHEVQAIINGLLDLDRYPNGRLLSDYPKTYQRDEDPTPFSIFPNDSLSTVQTIYYLCPDSSVLINPIGNQNSYDVVWENGATSPFRLVDEPGLYPVTISDACISRVFEISVEPVFITVDLGADQTVIVGSELEILAQVDHSLPIDTYSWFINDTISVECENECLLFQFIPEEETIIHLSIKDNNGCTASTAVKIKVELPFYTPNVFSPNRDGINDWFFIQTPIPIKYENFRIFDRWGGLLFEQKEGITNDPHSGWNGFYDTKIVSQGVYIWEATLILDSKGKEIHISGDIMVVK